MLNILISIHTLFLTELKKQNANLSYAILAYISCIICFFLGIIKKRNYVFLGIYYSNINTLSYTF